MESRDVIALLRGDYQEISELFAKIAACPPTNIAGREVYFVHLKTAYERLRQAEDETVYLSLQEEPQISELRSRHALLTRLLADMDLFAEDDASFGAKFDEARTAFQKLCDAEEQDLFPIARERLMMGDLSRLGDDYQKAKDNAQSPARRKLMSQNTDEMRRHLY